MMRAKIQQAAWMAVGYSVLICAGVWYFCFPMIDQFELED